MMPSSSIFLSDVQVIPLAVVHFEDTVFVASCALLLELCGLSASILRIDIAALRRISSFYKSNDNNPYKQLSPKDNAFYSKSLEVNITESLARALADDYRHDYVMEKGDKNYGTSNQPTRALMLVLQHLEKASLPLLSDGMTCGSWLLTGNGDGADLRSQQKVASERWHLVTVFCQMHNIPLSTKYLAILARDNDWVHFMICVLFNDEILLYSKSKDRAICFFPSQVGFLSEAQFGGYLSDTVIQVVSFILLLCISCGKNLLKWALLVSLFLAENIDSISCFSHCQASKEFSDPRLKIHILTVLRSMLRKKVSSSSNLDAAEKRNETSFSNENLYTPVELFGIIAECEKGEKPGEALLLKAKNLRWSILAMVASCFADVSPLSCLTVWLEITAARSSCYTHYRFNIL